MSCFTTRRATRFSWLSISTLPGRRPETESLNFPKKLFLAKKRGNFDCVARSSVQLFANHSLPPRSLFFENRVDNNCSLHLCLSRSVFPRFQKRDVPERLAAALRHVQVVEAVAGRSETYSEIVSGSGCRCKSSPPK